MSQVKTSLSHFIQQALKLTPDGHFSSEFDPDWRSMCEVEQQDDRSLWKPCAQPDPVNFSGLANAVEAGIHPDIRAYYSSFWSGALQARSDEGPVTLIQLWNQDDFERLIKNLIGHLFTQNRARLSFTVFFATTDPDSELFLSIDNSTGKILLESPGQKPLREVESDIATFLNRLEPDLTEPGIY